MVVYITTSLIMNFVWHALVICTVGIGDIGYNFLWKVCNGLKLTRPSIF